MTVLTKITPAHLNAHKLSLAFKALADPNRLRILSLLKKTGCCTIATRANDKGMCACDIEEQIDLSQPTISHHMRVLREAGLVDAEKIGPWMWYRRNESLLQEIGKALSSQI